MLKHISIKIYLISIILLIPSTKSFSADKSIDVDNTKWTKKYDMYFKKYTKRYFGVGFDFRWFKSQAIVESSLRKNAKSWVGAKGLMQIMPRTFEEIKEKNPYFKNVLEPRWNIAAGIFYDRRMYRFWKSDRPFLDKMGFALASYNAGAQNILKGQEVCQKIKRRN